MRSRRWTPVSLALASLFAAAGCGEAGSGEPRATVVDSAGVRVVDHPSLAAPTWSVAPEPILTLGVVDGEGPESFFRVSSAVRTGDGAVTVFDAGSAEVRVFSASGDHVRTVGGQGQGPGEFMGVARMRVLSDDRLAVWDTRARRLSIFGSEGGLERTISPDGIERRPQLIAVLDDGATLFQQEITERGPPPTEPRQNFANYILWGPNGEVLDTLPRQEHVEVILWGEGPLVGPLVFGRATAFAGDGTSYWIGTTKNTRLERYALDGTLEVVVRWPDVDRAVRPDDADRLLAAQLAGVTDAADRERRTEMHAATPVADVFPAHGDLFVDRLGMLWMQEYERPGRTEPARWWVFDRDGTLRGEVRLPLGARLFDAGDDYVVVGRTDAVGVEYVDVLSLDRPES